MNHKLIYLAVFVTLIGVHLLVPPKLESGISYLYFILGYLFIQFAFNFVKFQIKERKSKSDKIFYNLNEIGKTKLIIVSLNSIAISTFIYFLYVHIVLLQNSSITATNGRMYEYVYREVSYYMTINENQALYYWEYSTLLLMLAYVACVFLLNGKQRKK